MTKKFNKDQINDYMDKITEDQTEQLIEHCNKHEIFPDICAWYDNMEDLIGDYKEHCDYTEKETLDMFSRETQMFCTFSNGEIVKLVY